MIAWLPLVAVIAATLEPIDHARLVNCIIQVEGGSWGRLGGAGCMKEKVWNDRTTLPYRLSANPEFALPVYADHVRWLAANVSQPTPQRVALAWRWGIRGMKSHAKDDYGQRVANLYHENR